MRILAFDFGCKTGWASKRDDRIESGIQTFELGRGESPGMRFLRFNVWLEAMIRLVQPELCVYEQAHHRGGYATELLVGMATRLQERCATSSIEYMPVHTGMLKKWATGKGSSDKERMKLAAQKKFSKIPEDDNEADALLLLAYAMEKVAK
jgi:Holliday junction resolvasome RuvABC endonuclease subunit